METKSCTITTKSTRNETTITTIPGSTPTITKRIPSSSTRTASMGTMAKRFSGLVARIATRMMPVVRKAELKRLTNRKSGSSQKAKKFKPSKAGANASKQKSVKFKVKKVKR